MLSGGTLTIVESSAVTADQIKEYAVGDYKIVDSAELTGINFTGVTNIVFYANTSNVNLTLETPTVANESTAGNVSVIGNGSYNGLTVTFDNGFNVKGRVTVSNEGAGSSLAVAAGQDTFGNFTVNGGSAIPTFKQFVSITDAKYNGSVVGTLVDLEGTTVNGPTTINLGVGGGGFITNYTLDFGNSENDGINDTKEVTLNGNVTVNDIATQTDDIFEFCFGTVVGNVSINIAGHGNEDQTAIQELLIEGNLNVTVGVNSGSNESVALVNSLISGNTSLVEYGSGTYAYAYLGYDETGGNISVNQVNGSSGYVNLYSVEIVRGSFNVKQTEQTNYAYLGYLTLNKGAVVVNQSGSNENEVIFQGADLVQNTLTVNQTFANNNQFALVNSSTSTNVTVNQLAGVYNASVYFGYDTINGSVTISHVFANNADYTADTLDNVIIKGNLSINSAGVVNNVVSIENSSVAGLLTITQAVPASAHESPSEFGFDQIFLANTSVHGNVSINQPSGSDDYAGFFANTSINGNLTINEGSPDDNNVDFNNSSLVGNISIVQGTALEDLFDIVNGSSVLGTVTITQTSTAGNDVIFDTSTVHHSVSINQTVSYNDSVSFSNVSTLGNVTLSQQSLYHNTLDLFNSSVSGNVSLSQIGNEYAYFQCENGSTISGNLTINQSGNLGSTVEIENNSSIGKNVSITMAGSEDFVTIASGVNLHGSLTANLGNGRNEVAIYDSTISGATTLNYGLSGIGVNDLYLGDYGSSTTTLNGPVAVNMGNGTNYLDFGNVETVVFTNTVNITGNASGTNTYVITDTTEYVPGEFNLYNFLPAT